MGRKGFTLADMVVTLAVSAITVLVISRAIVATSKFFFHVSDRVSLQGSLQQVGSLLKKEIAGTKGFQHLAIRFPGIGASMGTGFYVVPDTNFTGNPSVGNDTLYIVVAEPMGAYVKLSSAITRTPATLPLEVMNSPLFLSGVFISGQLMIISDSKRSDAIVIDAVFPDASSATFLLDPACAGNFRYTFSPGGCSLQSGYPEGSFVTRARIAKVGLDTVNNILKLERQNGVPGSQFNLAEGVDKFSVSYTLMPPVSQPRCNAIVTPIGEYSRANWDTLNTNNNNLCYERILSIKIQMVAHGKSGAATQNAEIVINTNL